MYKVRAREGQTDIGKSGYRVEQIGKGTYLKIDKGTERQKGRERGTD